MPYHDLADIGVQRFRTLAEIDASNPTVEEREEYERPLDDGIVVYAGVDYEAIDELARRRRRDPLGRRQQRPPVPALRPPARRGSIRSRAGDELAYHPGEAIEPAQGRRRRHQQARQRCARSRSNRSPRHRAAQPGRPRDRGRVPVELADGPSLEGRPVLVVEDRPPSVTHGGMAAAYGSRHRRRPAEQGRSR
ncbi:MAG: hypothetical protein U0R24_10080 [Solirubrobacterales bacterium]